MKMKDINNVTMQVKGGVWEAEVWLVQTPYCKKHEFQFKLKDGLEGIWEISIYDTLDGVETRVKHYGNLRGGAEQRIWFDFALTDWRIEVKRTDETVSDRMTGEAKFRKELTSLIIDCLLENGSDTPDFVLANLLGQVLNAFDQAVRERNRLYNKKGD